jgi:ABC-type polysaccharide/polyol phosphate transport system ATPase subunit
MPPAVAFKRVSKRFALRRDRPQSLQEFVIGLATGRRRGVEDFWALKEIDFEVQAGETFGIIGPNGAGKSTALGLMARTIRPTGGQVLVEGRISPLLELGAGFHPDLTGTENVYLNAALFGLSRSETDARLQDIVEFSELNDFIDVPLKHYSTGMYARLGFAVAVHVDAAILLVDEVLAVGDEAFQRKCLAKMEEFQREGHTIIFVSHSLPIVLQVCNRALWLDHGRVQAIGAVEQVVGEYLEAVEGAGA